LLIGDTTMAACVVPARTLARPIRVVIADDESMFRTSLRQLLAIPPEVIRGTYGVEVRGGFEVVAEAGSDEETVEIVRSELPDLLLLDLSMPRRSGLEALRALGCCEHRLRTIILSGTLDRSQLVSAIQLGACGVIRKDATIESLFEAMAHVAAGASWIDQLLVSDLMDVVRALAHLPSGTAPGRPYGLTRRERDVLSLVAEGFNNKEIAQRFALSERTVKHHLTRIFDKVGADNRVELALAAARHGLLN
jgi:two-component system, NarL family, nitrate/nitrite response regulator NarL